MKRFQYNSPVVLTYFFISLAVLISGILTGGFTTRLLFSVYRTSFSDPFAYLRVFGHVLGHADMSHFLSNMLLLLVVGPPLEEKYGSKVLLTGIVLTALISGILQLILFPQAALLGASGIVFMMIMLSSLSGMENGRIPLTLILVAILYLGREIHSMLFVEDSVANFMHIVGGACGTVFGFSLAKRKISRK